MSIRPTRRSFAALTTVGVAVAGLALVPGAPVQAAPAPLSLRWEVSQQFDDHLATHTYADGGRYFPSVTVTDDQGASATMVDEILVDLPAAPTVHTGGASGTVVHGAVSPENQDTSWSVEYGPTEEYGAVKELGM